MKLIEGLKLEGRPVEIPNCSRDDLPELFVDLGFKVGAEIGVAGGEFSEKLSKKGLEVYAIDPWLSYEDYKHSRGQKAMEEVFLSARERLAPYPNCKIVRKTSVEASFDFVDRSLDFVYLDGNHQLMYIIQDLVIWSRKVKLGGIISGHDYIYTNPKNPAGIVHVIYALDAYTKAYNIDNLYLLGRKKAEGETRDRFRSWMFVNTEVKLRNK